MGYIYKIVNNKNNKAYVGQTKYSIELRFTRHKYDAKKRKLKDMPLYKAINKYGIDNFYIEEIEKCDNTYLNEREIYWINKLGTYENGYNATKGGDGNKKIDILPQDIFSLWKKGNSIKQISNKLCISETVVSKSLRSCEGYLEMSKKRYLEKVSQERGVEVVQYSISGNKLNEFKSIGEASRKLNIPIQLIHNCCSLKYKKTHNYQFRYKNNAPNKLKPIKNTIGKYVSQYDMNGNFIKTFSSGKEASLETKIPDFCIRQCCRGRSKSAGNYIWKYEEQNNE